VKKLADIDDFVEHVCLLLAPLGEIRPRKMFGGYGVYVDEVFIAIVAYDTLWFKVDEVNEPDYREAGSRPFKPWEDRETVMSYWEVPADVLDDRRAITAWGRKALEAAQRAAAAKKPKSVRPRATKKT
jgi:DNA transformation protein